MKSYDEVYQEWFDGKENVIVLSESPLGQLIVGFCEDIVSVGYIINFGDKYDISIDTQFKPNWNMFTDNDLTHYIKNTYECLYQIMFNVLYCVDKRKIKYKIDINRTNKDIDRFFGMCTMNKFIIGLKTIIDDNMEIQEY
jgi:hypothetical protein